MKMAVIVLGHGSKAPQALETLNKYGEMVKAKSRCEIVEVASLQFNKPDLPEALDRVIEHGAKKIVIVPFFLYNGVHMQEDIPAVIRQEKDKFPDVDIVLANHLGADQRLVDIVLDRIKEVS
ncbi:MAG: CbiX/SirB N-terminal domain-containing protein [Thermincola sp.]|jgi:sirohydrochlorin ferrochelatase|nr:CbiX/SirB N-terminal domain-containing protein [Thermincola sp.]MDT3703598.1 CbiX/SirB N-terminal domain-containing protein [Thermincola sp.]